MLSKKQQNKIKVMEQLLNAYYQVLELAKENAFKCVIWVDTNKVGNSNFFEVMVKPANVNISIENIVFFYDFQPNEFENNIEKVKQLIREASC